jgi:hypothetical protein
VEELRISASADLPANWAFCHLECALLVTKRSNPSKHPFAVFRGKALLILQRLSKARRDFVVGVRYGYPLCCVLNYTLDSVLGTPAALRRGETLNPRTGTYVPCHFHKRVQRALSPTESMQLLKSGFSVEHLAPDDFIETRVNGRVVTSVRVPKGLDAVFVSQVRFQD